MKQIPLTHGKFALVDDEDYEYLNQWKWCYGKTKNGNDGYAFRNAHNTLTKSQRTRSYMHREVMNLDFGDKRQVDHTNHNGIDNQKLNLRICTHQENLLNKSSRKGSTSKYLGVSLHRNNNPVKYTKKDGTLMVYERKVEQVYWIAQVAYNNTHHRLGRFKTESEAALAYNKKALELFGEFANLNVVEA